MNLVETRSFTRCPVEPDHRDEPNPPLAEHALRRSDTIRSPQRHAIEPDHRDEPNPPLPHAVAGRNPPCRPTRQLELKPKRASFPRPSPDTQGSRHEPERRSPPLGRDLGALGPASQCFDVGGREPQGKPLLVLRTIDVNELVVEDAPSRVRVEPRGDAPLFRDDIGRKDFVTDPDPRSRPRTEAKGVV